MAERTHPGGAPAILALADGTLFHGQGFGATGTAVGELCFNTAMTGYQEILTDPSYAGQIVTFTFPHIGITGTTPEDDEASSLSTLGLAAPGALGLVTRCLPTAPSNWRSTASLHDWLVRRGRIGIAGVDTRRLTRAIRTSGMPHVALGHGDPDPAALIARARAFAGVEGADLARGVTTDQRFAWDEGVWTWGGTPLRQTAPRARVVAIDYGAKRNILRRLAQAGCAVIVLPATATAEQVLAQQPDGVFLSNGPGDPAATGAYAVPMIQGVLAADLPVFGICLGHQMLALALGGRTVKMTHGHHGANHPVQDLETGRVEITSMNHGFAVDAASLPDGVVETHKSLFDGSNCGLRVVGKPVFSVQHHPEASPGPDDAGHLFARFVAAVVQGR